MIWLTWRQIRTPAIVLLAGLGVVIALLLITAPGVSDAYQAGGVADCIAGNENPNAAETCGDIEDRFLSNYGPLQSVGDWLGFMPALIGAFWGAPLLTREYEAGTHRLAWTQSITRRRWLAIKLAVLGGLSVAVTAILSLVYTWWMGPFDRIGARVSPTTFGERGIAPAMYAGFAFVLGVAIGAVIRRTLPAMAAVLAVYLAVHMAIQTWVRPHLLTPHEISFPTFTFFGPDPPGWTAANTGWILSERTVDRAGHVLPDGGPELDDRVMDLCGEPDLRATKERLDACGQELGLQDIVKFHSANSFWTLQAWETAIFTGLTLSLVAFCFRWTRRRIA